MPHHYSLQQALLIDIASNPKFRRAYEVRFGYWLAKIDEGRALWTRTQEAIESKTLLKDLSASAYRQLLSLQNGLTTKYSLHRMKAKIVFESFPSLINHLLLNKPLTRSYVP